MVALEALERRRLMSGGLDPSFGSATGVAFVGPGQMPSVLDTSVDRDGRVMLAGGAHRTVNGISQQEMFIARVHTNGQLDGRFGIDGTVEGTPRGLQTVEFIVPLASGGYLAAGSTATQGSVDRLVRFKPGGALDVSFGKNGALTLPITPAEILEQADGTVLLLGDAPPHHPESDADKINYIVRLNAAGRIDPTFGDGGFADIGNELFSDGIVTSDAFISSAAIDPAGRLLVAFKALKARYAMPDSQDLQEGSVTLYVQRFLADGTVDPSFGDSATDRQATVYSRTFTDDPALQPTESGIVLPRPDGRIAVLHRSDISAPPAFVATMDANGTVTTTSVALATLAPSFSSSFAATVLADNSIVLAGTRTSGTGAAGAPALIRLKADLTFDSQFGSGGFLSIAGVGGLSEAARVELNPDGTLTALLTGAANGQASPPSPRIVRAFADDRPVVTLTRVRSDASNVRVTVAIRGVNSINTASLDDNDLRLQDAMGARVKLRLVNWLETGGVVTATYRVNRSLFAPGVFLLRGIDQQVRDDNGNGDAGRVIATIGL